jgi:excinuclease ABC subunit C
MPDLSYTAVADQAAFEERLKNVPLAPGVYQWKDANGKLLYVGKSKSLRDRMRSYFGSPRALNGKTRALVRQIADFEIIITQSELEALLLEMNLIKQHRPRYNILLKDDKSYPYIKITLQHDWPRVMTTRNVVDDGARYFGPYASAGSVYRTLDLLNRLFSFRPKVCDDTKFSRYRKLGKPCLYHDMKRCLGPCVPMITKEEYRAAIQSVVAFLEGKSDKIARDIRKSMEQAAEELNFERAAYLRDRLKGIEKVLEKQQVLKTVDTDQDVIAFAREEGSAVVQVFYIRGGKLIGAEPFTLQGTEDESDARLLQSFVTQFYDNAPYVPPNLLLAEHVEEPMIIESWLAKKGNHKVQIEVPRRGEKRQLVELAARNAQQKLDELRVQWLNSEQRAVAGLSELRDLLELPALPQRIECYDISNTQGANSVASMVVFEYGEPKPAHYRRFKIKTVEGANDVASIQEVLRRRFKRAAAALGDSEVPATVATEDRPATGDDPTGDEGETTRDPQPANPEAQSEAEAAWARLPDLLLIDGGRGQLNGAMEVLKELGFDTIPTVGVAKGVDRNRFDLVRPNVAELVVLARDSKALLLVQRVDEEAHRFAITYHRKLRSKATFKSPLEDIPGIGPRRKQALLKRFGSLDGIRSASIEELMTVPGMTKKAAEELKSQI